MKNNTRKICIAVHSRANYGRVKSLMRAVQEHPDLELQIVVGASALLYRFGSAIDVIRSDGFEPDATCHMVIEGGTPATMAKSTGLGIIEMTSFFEHLQPDIVLTVADRYETLATAIAASYMNLPLAHTQGGEVTGSIDESVRHAITKLSHIHLPATALAAENLVRLGEDPEKVFLIGCPAMDLLVDLDLSLPGDFFQMFGGVGAAIDVDKPYIVVLQHPVTTEYASQSEQILQTLKAVQSLDMQTVWLWPNVDAGTDDISKQLRVFREQHPEAKIHFFRNFAPEDYARLINNCACLLGNSSSGIREGAFLGIPAVNIGTRQRGREQGENVVNADCEAGSIEAAVRAQIAHGRFQPSQLFGAGDAGRRGAEVLASVDLGIDKRLHY